MIIAYPMMVLKEGAKPQTNIAIGTCTWNNATTGTSYRLKKKNGTQSIKHNTRVDFATHFLVKNSYYVTIATICYIASRPTHLAFSRSLNPSNSY